MKEIDKIYPSMNTFYDMGSIMAAFLAILVFTKKYKTVADYILGSWLLLISINIFVHYRVINPTDYVKIFIVIDFFCFLTHGSILYLYTLTLTNKKIDFKKIIYFIPAFLFTIHIIIRTLTNQSSKIMMLYMNLFNQKCWKCGLIQLYAVFSIPIFLILAYRELYLYNQNVLNKYSFLEEVELNWLKRFIIGVGISWFLFVFLEIISFYKILSFPGESLDYSFVCISIVVLYLGIYGIKNTGIFSDSTNRAIINDLEPENIKIDQVNNKILIENSNELNVFNEDHFKIIKDQLVSFMEKNKPFLKSRLTLKELSIQINIPIQDLSFVINKIMKTNFFDFINTYRVKEFTNRMELPQYNNYTHIGIAFDCGFSSKSSFYSIFKKQMGCTPQEYILKKI